ARACAAGSRVLRGCHRPPLTVSRQLTVPGRHGRVAGYCPVTGYGRIAGYCPVTGYGRIAGYSWVAGHGRVLAAVSIRTVVPVLTTASVLVWPRIPACGPASSAVRAELRTRILPPRARIPADPA